MTSMPIRDPLTDHLLTPQNSALVLIDYQDAQIYSIPTDPDLYVPNAVALVKVARLFGLPIVVSTVQRDNGVNGDTIPQLREQLGDVPSIDRMSINAWEDEDFVHAVKATGRRKLIMGGCGPRSASPCRRSTRCAKASRSTPWSTLSRGPHQTPTSGACAASCRRARSL